MLTKINITSNNRYSILKKVIVKKTNGLIFGLKWRCSYYFILDNYRVKPLLQWLFRVNLIRNGCRNVTARQAIAFTVGSCFGTSESAGHTKGIRAGN